MFNKTKRTLERTKNSLKSIITKQHFARLVATFDDIDTTDNKTLYVKMFDDDTLYKVVKKDGYYEMRKTNNDILKNTKALIKFD